MILYMMFWDLIILSAFENTHTYTHSLKLIIYNENNKYFQNQVSFCPLTKELWMLSRQKIILKITLYRHAFLTHISRILRFFFPIMSVCKYYTGPEVLSQDPMHWTSEIFSRSFVVKNMQWYTRLMGHDHNSVVEPVISNCCKHIPTI